MIIWADFTRKLQLYTPQGTANPFPAEPGEAGVGAEKVRVGGRLNREGDGYMHSEVRVM